MCLAVIYWQPSEYTPLKIVANRDEFRQRSTAPMHWWAEQDILAGQDLVAGGTWLGFSRLGRFALLTNIRPGFLGVSGEKSRGGLVTRFLANKTISLEQYRHEVNLSISQYAGFNLILGDNSGLLWFSSNDPDGRYLAPGIHALSNDSLNTPWPKAKLAVEQMRQHHARMNESLTSHSILSSRLPADDDELPMTGIPFDREKKLSSQTIAGEDYGTRSRTHATFAKNGKVRVAEQQLDINGQVIDELSFNFLAGEASPAIYDVD